VELLYIIDMAEIPTFQERQEIDKNKDGVVDTAAVRAAQLAPLPAAA
jgi:hypothetical protein